MYENTDIFQENVFFYKWINSYKTSQRNQFPENSDMP